MIFGVPLKISPNIYPQSSTITFVPYLYDIVCFCLFLFVIVSSVIPLRYRLFLSDPVCSCLSFLYWSFLPPVCLLVSVALSPDVPVSSCLFLSVPVYSCSFLSYAGLLSGFSSCDSGYTGLDTAGVLWSVV